MSKSIDPYEMARRQSELAGETLVRDFERLVPGLADDQGVVRWQAAFSPSDDMAGEPAVALSLTLATLVQVPCARCVEACGHVIDLMLQYRLVADEAIASRLDKELDNVVVLASGQRFDLHSLIEDELIMALPLMPRHEKCPEGAALIDGPDAVGPSSGLAEERQLPFADLASRLADGSAREQSAGPTPPRKRRR